MAKFIDLEWGRGGTLTAFAEALVAQSIDTDKIKQQMEEALDVIEETTMRYVPFDTGATQRSFYREVEVTPDAIIGRVGYNRDRSLDYVGVIHENPYGFSYINSKNNGQTEAQDFFLEKAFYQNVDVINSKFKG